MIVTSQAQAFSPGTELWVCPSYQRSPETLFGSSKWTAAIDWQLNFALSKYESHQSEEIGLSLQKIIAQTEFPIENHKQPNEFVLISTEAHLPAKWVLFFEPGIEPEKEFFNRILAKSEKLNVQNLRVFLPNQWALDSIQKFNLSNQFHVVAN